MDPLFLGAFVPWSDALDCCGALLWMEELIWITWQLSGMESGPLFLMWML